MIRNEYRERWAQWLPRALEALAKNPPDYHSVMPDMPLPQPEPVHFVRVSEPLKVAIISSSGAYHVRTQAPFAASAIVGDPTHRVLPIETPAGFIEFAHEHFDHTAAKQDLECIIPRKTLFDAGVKLSQHVISWSGFLLDWPTFIEATIPQIVKQVQTDGANAAVLVPI